jgi:hypothetical protein
LSNVLLIVTVRSSYLLVRNRQILVLVGGEHRTGKEIHCTAFVGLELVDDGSGITPTNEVAETL